MKKISNIVIDETIYPRENFDPDTVERYREAMAAGAKFPPLVITPDNRLLDGRHRLEAHMQIGTDDIKVTIEDPADPAARAVELNLQHGKPFTKMEMRELARKWYGTRPATEIAKTLGITRQTIQNWVSDLAAEREEAREEIREKALEMRADGLTQEDVAEKLGVDQATVSRWEYASVKNLTPAYWGQNEPETLSQELNQEETKSSNKDNQAEDQFNCYIHNGREIFVSAPSGSEYGTFWRSHTGGLHRVKSTAMPMVASRKEAQRNLDDWAEKKGLEAVPSDENKLINEQIEDYSADEREHAEDLIGPNIVNDLDLVKSLIGRCIETHYGTGGIVEEVTGPYKDGFYTITYRHPKNGKKHWINSITVVDDTVLCEGQPLKISLNFKLVHEKSQTNLELVQNEDPEDIKDYGGREAAESYRKKVLPYSDAVKEFYHQLKKASDLAEQLIDRREDMFEAVTDMKPDGVSITILANAAIQACDIYIPRLNEAKEMLQEVIKPGIKGVTVKDKFVVVKGGKTDGE